MVRRLFLNSWYLKVLLNLLLFLFVYTRFVAYTHPDTDSVFGHQNTERPEQIRDLYERHSTVLNFQSSRPLWSRCRGYRWYKSRLNGWNTSSVRGQVVGRRDRQKWVSENDGHLYVQPFRTRCRVNTSSLSSLVYHINFSFRFLYPTSFKDFLETYDLIPRTPNKVSFSLHFPLKVLVFTVLSILNSNEVVPWVWPIPFLFPSLHSNENLNDSNPRGPMRFLSIILFYSFWSRTVSPNVNTNTLGHGFLLPIPVVLKSLFIRRQIPSPYKYKPATIPFLLNSFPFLFLLSLSYFSLLTCQLSEERHLFVCPVFTLLVVLSFPNLYSQFTTNFSEIARVLSFSWPKQYTCQGPNYWNLSTGNHLPPPYEINFPCFL